MSTWTQDRPKTRIVGRFHGIFLLRIAYFRRSFTLLRLEAVIVAGLRLQFQFHHRRHWRRNRFEMLWGLEEDGGKINPTRSDCLWPN
ncbi:hypothetical protein RDI58_010239 [Solanum bulbocastanum]|uniref:Uncharacterized protein n=1 Tax=Solanum bulbocastanum TaxID=147425 RepID=A0AAN8YJ98_SOLBU